MGTNELNTKDLYWIVKRLPKEVTAILREHPAQVFVAGGFVRACVSGEDVADIDLFVPSVDMAHLVAAKLTTSATTRYNSKNAITIKLNKGNTPPVQIIHRWTYGAPQQVIESFDFTIAKSAVWWDGAGFKTQMHEDFYADLAAKRLVYTSPIRNEDTGGSLLRVLKFYQKGYRIPLDSMGAVIARLVMAVRDNNLTHDEGGLARVLTGLLHEVDPLLDPWHIFHLPSTATEAPNTEDIDAA